MQELGDLWVFIGALAVVYLVPGADMVLILQTVTFGGRAQAFAVAIGLGLARAVHVFLAAIGLAALLRTVPWAFEIVRVAGAAYLIWLGVGILRMRSLSPAGEPILARDDIRSRSAAARRGFLTNLLNPKALLFCSVLLPQFIRPDQGSVPRQFLALGAILVGIGLLFDLGYASAGMLLSPWLARHPLVEVVQRWTFALLLIGFGMHLALSQHP
ncbi:hypothetical protein GCM10019059_41590 [Camelimonas fluminis]|uniref:LysE family translocator n=1 Tax=Camelimonas fluminis TaxID=1576911 RepID=A0ABV7UQ32_9HYPH|nr:LysE family translocator [Camelimonas fluminis]GHE78502.1 hypothetical protein GCM10019059_41590 [Camelimonas fluminis]